jgi:hypothetical protein
MNELDIDTTPATTPLSVDTYFDGHLHAFGFVQQLDWYSHITYDEAKHGQ